MILSVCVVSLSRRKNGQKTLQCPCWSLLVFFDKKKFSLRLMYFLQESDRKSISCKNLARFLQEIFFLSGSCKKCIFCQNLARFVFFVKILQESCKNCICFQPGQFHIGFILVSYQFFLPVSYQLHISFSLITVSYQFHISFIPVSLPVPYQFNTISIPV